MVSGAGVDCKRLNRCASGLLGRIHVGMRPIVNSPNEPGQEAQSDEYFRNIQTPHGYSPNWDYRPIWREMESLSEIQGVRRRRVISGPNTGTNTDVSKNAFIRPCRG
jgi:hypothetical protein